jgi:hypothetical protein
MLPAKPSAALQMEVVPATTTTQCLFALTRGARSMAVQMLLWRPANLPSKNLSMSASANLIPSVGSSVPIFLKKLTKLIFATVMAPHSTVAAIAMKDGKMMLIALLSKMQTEPAH